MVNAFMLGKFNGDHYEKAYIYFGSFIRIFMLCLLVFAHVVHIIFFLNKHVWIQEWNRKSFSLRFHREFVKVVNDP